MALFAVKRQGGHDTMLVVEAATAEAADGWLVFRSADGQPLACCRRSPCCCVQDGDEAYVRLVSGECLHPHEC